MKFNLTIATFHNHGNPLQTLLKNRKNRGSQKNACSQRKQIVESINQKTLRAAADAAAIDFFARRRRRQKVQRRMISRTICTN